MEVSIQKTKEAPSILEKYPDCCEFYHNGLLQEPNYTAIFHDDFTRLSFKANSVDAIITDPPYGYPSLSLWERLAYLASVALKPSGFLITLSGQKYLPEVMKMLGSKLHYFWTATLEHNGAIAVIKDRNVENKAKLILIYTKTKGVAPLRVFRDLVKGAGQDKRYHPWGQPAEDLKPLIKSFSNPGDLILDPMVGGGSTAIACIDLKRRFIGIEIEKEFVRTTVSRINNYM